MSGLVLFEADLDHQRVFAMWNDATHHYRANIMLAEGADIPMHAHSYTHDYRLGAGTYGLVVESPAGIREPEQVLEGGSTGSVPAWWKHHFRLLKWGGEPGRVECFWPIGSDGR